MTSVRPTSWLLQDRVGFPEWVDATFRYPHRRRGGGGGGGDSELFLQQAFVRDYMQPGSPYAGLILYHAVGTGKSRAAIAAALLLAGGSYRVSVLLPSFIKKNFIREIREYPGHPLYEGQKWSRGGGGDGKGGEWTPSSSSGKFLAELSAEDREEVRRHLDRAIERRVRFVVYNGLTRGNTEALANEDPNPFEHAVTVVDEAHDFNAAVASGGLAAVLYERMMAAQDRKVILLTGTPFRNGPVEMPYLVNLAHGYVRTVHAEVLRGREEDVVRRAESSPYVNRVVVDHNTTTKEKKNGYSLHIQILPFGFVKEGSCKVVAVGEGGARGGRRVLDEDGVHAHLRHELRDVIGTSRIRHRLLLPVNESFLSAFTRADATEVAAGSDAAAMRRVEALTRRIAGTVSYFNVYDAETYPEVLDPPFRIVECPMSSHQFNAYSKLREVERKSERNSRIMNRMAGPDSADKSLHTYRSFTRQVCIFAFPQGLSRVYKKDIRRELALREETEAAAATADVVASDDTKGDDSVAKAYVRAKQESLERLMTQYPDALRLTPKTKNEGLAVHSPKMYTMLSHFAEVQYPMLVYSQFRQLEGLAILAASLLVNGYERVEIYREPDSRHKMRLRVTRHDSSSSSSSVHPPPPRFFIYDNADKEAADVGLRLYNSELDGLPGSVRADVRELLEAPYPTHAADENLHGRLVKLLLVTEAGSSGLSLKNVREVHILEPYWNEARGDQVTGRALRAHSHDRLPPAERNIRVFMYVAVFTAEQQSEPTIQNLDGGRTSDQYLLRIAKAKGAVIRTMHTVLQRAAADCMLHREAHRASRSVTRRGTHECLTYPSPERGGPSRCDFAYALDDAEDMDAEDMTMPTRREREVRLVAVKKKGRLFYADEETGELYDYREAKERGRLAPPASEEQDKEGSTAQGDGDDLMSVIRRSMSAANLT